jgi:ABC-type transporter Mla subunit MlaD
MKTAKFSDWAIALTVIICSVILFAALALALGGVALGPTGRTVRINFPDVTGIQASSKVKYGGALAGTVTSVRMLTPDERRASGNPVNAVEINVALEKSVPPLTADTIASISSDTLLSDKFVLLSPGLPNTPMLAGNASIQGIPPTTFDKTLRNLDTILVGLERTFGGKGADFDAFLPRLGGLFDDLQSTLAETRALLPHAKALIDDGTEFVHDGRTLVADATGLVGDAKSLVNDNKAGIKNTITKLEKTADSLDALTVRIDALVRNNAGNLDASLRDLRVISDNLKATSTYARILTKSLAERPQQLIWGPGRKPNSLPTDQQILGPNRSTPQ